MVTLWAYLTPRRLLALIMAVALFALAVRPVTDPDLWWHLRTGQWILENRAIPMTDPFSLTEQGKRWVEHEWLANVGLYLLYQVGGLNALILAGSLVITLTFCGVYRLSELRPHLAVFTTLTAALATAFTWDPRPQMLSMLFAVLLLLILRRGRNGAEKSSHRLWLVPPLMLLWVNVHSGFFLGLIILGTAWLGEAGEWALARWLAHRVPPAATAPPSFEYLKRLTVIAILAFGVTLINPNGIAMHLTPLATLGNKTIPLYIVEWRSPNFHDQRFLPYAALWLGLIGVFALSRQRPSLTDLLFVLGFGYESLVSARHIPFFAIIAAPLITRQAAVLLPQRTDMTGQSARAPLLNWGVALLAMVAALMQVTTVLDQTSQQVARVFPVGAADYLLREKPAGPLLNSYNHGGYLIWRLYPSYPVFIDGRAEFIYEDRFIAEFYERIWQARGDWQAYLDRYAINLVVVEQNGALSLLLRADTRWRLAYEDQTASVFERTR